MKTNTNITLSESVSKEFTMHIKNSSDSKSSFFEKKAIEFNYIMRQIQLKEIVIFCNDGNTMHDITSDSYIHTIKDAKEFLNYCLENEKNTKELENTYKYWLFILDGKLNSELLENLI